MLYPIELRPQGSIPPQNTLFPLRFQGDSRDSPGQSRLRGMGILPMRPVGVPPTETRGTRGQSRCTSGLATQGRDALATRNAEDAIALRDSSNRRPTICAGVRRLLRDAGASSGFAVPLREGRPRASSFRHGACGRRAGRLPRRSRRRPVLGSGLRRSVGGGRQDDEPGSSRQDHR
jgi:hypothetical protein